MTKIVPPIAWPQIAWSEDLSVGHKKLDDQHKGLIRLINNFGRGDLPQMELADSLDGLIAYAARHFNDEENYIMRKAPDLLTHQVDCHAAFIETAYDFAHRFNEGEDKDEDLRRAVYDYLCGWLLRHIREEDQQYNQKPKA